jgi:hypothetical protein
MEREKNERT